MSELYEQYKFKKKNVCNLYISYIYDSNRASSITTAMSVVIELDQNLQKFQLISVIATFH